MSNKKPARTWALVLSLGVPLGTVAILAMAISYVTLIDVAVVNKIPLPILFPIIIDVGMIGVMIVAAQLRIRGLSGSWLAYLLFTGLSIYSVMANATHALGSADLTQTTAWAAGITAAIPPTVLLGFTHLVMKLIPSQKERERLALLKEKQATLAAKQASANSQSAMSVVAPTVKTPNLAQLEEKSAKEIRQPIAAQTSVGNEEGKSVTQLATSQSFIEPATLALVPATPVAASDEEVTELVAEYVREHGKKPTGRIVGEWLGKSPKTGSRFLTKLEETQELENLVERMA